MALIRNIAGATVNIDDIGISLAAAEEYDLSLESPRVVYTSDDLRARINAGEIAVVDPLDNVTALGTSDSLDVVNNFNNGNFRSFGTTLEQVLNVDTTGAAQNYDLRYNASTQLWEATPAPPPPPSGGTNFVQLFWGPINPVSGTTTIPKDSTAPQITEGTQVVSQAITPTETTSTIRIAVNATISASNASMEFIFAVFRDSTCVGTAVNSTSNKDSGFSISFEIYDVPASTANLTYSVRVGKAGGGGTWYVNQIASGETFGNTLENNSFSVEEIGLVG